MPIKCATRLPTGDQAAQGELVAKRRVASMVKPSNGIKVKQDESEVIIPARFEGLWAQDQPPEKCHDDSGKDHYSGDIHHQLVDEISCSTREGDGPWEEKEHVQKKDDRTNHLDGDPYIDELVHDSRISLLEDANLNQGMHEEITRSAAGLLQMQS